MQPTTCLQRIHRAFAYSVNIAALSSRRAGAGAARGGPGRAGGERRRGAVAARGGAARGGVGDGALSPLRGQERAGRGGGGARLRRAGRRPACRRPGRPARGRAGGAGGGLRALRPGQPDAVPPHVRGEADGRAVRSCPGRGRERRPMPCCRTGWRRTRRREATGTRARSAAGRWCTAWRCCSWTARYAGGWRSGDDAITRRVATAMLGLHSGDAPAAPSPGGSGKR